MKIVYQAENIIAAFEENGQLHNATYLTSNYERLRLYLEKATRKKFEISGRAIKELGIQRTIKTNDDGIPF